MQNVSKEKLDTGPSLANTQLNNMKVPLSSEYWLHTHVSSFPRMKVIFHCECGLIEKLLLGLVP